MDTKDFRHEMHCHPELPFAELCTFELIAKELEQACIDFCYIGKAGILARIEGRRGNTERGVVLHTNVGAMAVDEHTGVEFASQHDGVMHACGNDCHTAVLLGVLKRLQATRDFEGTLLGVFESGEGCCGGSAQSFLTENPFKNYNVAAIISERVSSELEVGEVGFCPGKFMASYDDIRFEIKGVGGDASCAKIAKNPVIALAELVLRLNTFNSEVCKVSINKLLADGSAQTLSDVASCEGVMYTFDEKLRGRVKDMILGAVQEIEYKLDVEIEFTVDERSMCVENDKPLSYEAMLFAGSNGLKVKDMDRTFETSDFGRYSQLYPSMLYRLGVGRESGNIYGSTFLPGDKALEVGEEFMYQLALNILNR